VAEHRYTLLDVFTATPLQGNQLAVIHGADGVPDAVMHAMARETKLSETSFVQSASASGADYRHRIWMMRGEIPFAGHPSLGAAVAVARERDVARATLVQETLAGLQPIDVEVDGPRARASMLQEPPRHGAELDSGEVLAMVGLGAQDADRRAPVQVVATGVPQVIAPVRGPDALARCRPDYDRIATLLRAHDAIVLYVCWIEPHEGRARARSFLLSAEEGEDPATGAAAGPLCAYANSRFGLDAITITQGVEMGRPSTLRASVDGDRVRVEGDVVVVADGTVRLPDSS
jgi:trans-2,3-dihydro-3-hydroxyanthranilate isomerase